MGSVVLFFLAPITILITFFGSIFGFLSGTDKTEIALPYEPSKGLVWEMQGGDYPFELVETKENVNEQIFVIKGFEEDKYKTDKPVPVIFIAENGEEILYYAIEDAYISKQTKFNFYSPEEYILFSYSPFAEAEINGKWKLDTYRNKNLYFWLLNESHTAQSFDYLLIKSEASWKATEEYIFSDENGNPVEKLEVTFKLENGEIKTVKDLRKYRVNNEWYLVPPNELKGDAA